MLRRLITILVLIAAAAAVAWALWPQPVAVETTQIARQDIAITIEEEAKSRIRAVFTVSAPIAGQMLRVNLNAGDAVIKDESIVASIQPAGPGLLDARARRVAEAAVEAARAAVDFAAAEVRQAEAQLAFATEELTRATMLVRRGTISARAYDKAKLDEETATAALQSANASLRVRQRELERAEAALIEGSSGGGNGTCCVEVRAPVSGRVLRVLTQSEQVVQAGTPMVEIGDPADIEIVSELLSRDAVRITPGAAAIIDGWGGPPLAARVTRIDPSAVTKVSALGIEEQRVSTILRLDGDPAQWASLGHGFRVVVHISLLRVDQAVAVPIGALFRKGADWAVYVVAGGKARLRTLEIGARNTEHAEVLAGLTEGDVVILHPSDLVEDGVAVNAAPLP